ncbi:MAG: squalene synthase HpnC [Sulfuritalea sp.]|nr:squalene synthase HpnC [Sulfuritalea sp.]
MTALSSPPAITHAENFPVASFLCPPALRAPIAAIYHFARTADDMADEGDAPAQQRLADLSAYREALRLASQGQVNPKSPWAWIFTPLAQTLQNFKLPVQLLYDLLDAFVQDVEKTRDAQGYADTAELLDYCRRSANPVGRLLLHLYGISEAAALAQSDGICTALQRINFLQDSSRDLPRGRNYFPHDAMHAVQLQPNTLQSFSGTSAAHALVLQGCQATREQMQASMALVHRIPGRAGWELRFVIQGALRVLDKVENLQSHVFKQCPCLRWWDTPTVLWRVLRMSVRATIQR